MKTAIINKGNLYSLVGDPVLTIEDDTLFVEVDTKFKLDYQYLNGNLIETWLLPVDYTGDKSVPKEILGNPIVLPFIDTTKMAPSEMLMRLRMEAALKKVERSDNAVFNLVEFILLIDKLKDMMHGINKTVLNNKSTSIDFVNSSLEYFMDEIDASLDLSESKESK